MAINDSLPLLGFLMTFDMLKKTPFGVQFNINNFCCNLFEVGPIFVIDSLDYVLILVHITKDGKWIISIIFFRSGGII